MLLTILALPLLILGVFVTPYTIATGRCFTIGLISKSPFCFEAASNMPEILKYGSLALGFALIYAGRHQIRRAKGQK